MINILKGEILFDIITNINILIESSSENIYLFSSIITLYDKFIMSNSINTSNFKKILEKIFAHVEFILQKVLLYTNLKDNIEVTKYFKKNVTNKISRSTIKDLYDHKNIPLEYNSDIRLKIFFCYK